MAMKVAILLEETRIREVLSGDVSSAIYKARISDGIRALFVLREKRNN